MFASLLAIAAALTTTSCSDSDTVTNNTDATQLDYTAENAAQWGNYMINTALLLKQDANTLYNQWAVEYTKRENGKEVSTGNTFAYYFKTHDSKTAYRSTNDCIQEMVEKMAEIANEVGSSKIGEPYNLWKNGDQTAAVLAVESWFSWHSRDDYTNNIRSIRNAYYGTRDCYTADSISAHSLAAAISASNPTLHARIVGYIANAMATIQGISQPFRSHIDSEETVKAIDACGKLQRIISEIESEEGEAIAGEAVNLRDAALALDEDVKAEIINNFVDNVVVPTYKELNEKNAALYTAVVAFVNNPSNAGFENCAKAWLEARQPWETSEAFLFGPVDELGLDPNMDSWPLDAEGISQVLKNSNWAALTWSYTDDDEAIAQSQNLRGFHTLEYLIFKNGKARTISK